MVERREFVSALPRLLSVAQPLRSTDLFSSNKPEVCWAGLFCNWRPYLFVRNVCANVTLQSLSTYRSYKMKTKLTILHHLIPLRNIKFRAFAVHINEIILQSILEKMGGGGEINSVPSLIRRPIISRHANPDVTRFFTLSP